MEDFEGEELGTIDIEAIRTEVDGKVRKALKEGKISEEEIGTYTQKLEEELMNETKERLGNQKKKEEISQTEGFKVKAELAKAKNGLAEQELKRKIIEGQKELVDIDRQRKQDEALTLHWTHLDREGTIGEAYNQLKFNNPDFKMGWYGMKGDMAIDKIAYMSERRREDKNKAFESLLQHDGTIGREGLLKVEKYIANEDERKAFDSFLNGSNGQIDLLEFMKQMPETIKGYLEAGNYEINAVIDAAGRTAETTKTVTDSIFTDGNTYQNTFKQLEELKGSIGISEIENATKDARLPEIDTETKTVKAVATNTLDKNNTMEERE